ncbi:hypothetical protein DUD43_09110 [Alcaligenes faecalis]|uniref:hypothetical protein n=1 Tax=Alcaligenes faecalis TaxID=511 RepID=UPI001293A538|nr:hypothetical protein [Alcaligenes faecalis]QFY77829.1 hypothetical protein DUD43_09110 [Alcaligenes faecalis]
MTIDDFLRTRYKPFGRIVPELDCWGLVRLARASLFGRPMLPSYSETDPDDKAGLTMAASEVREQGGFKEVPPSPGAIATGWRARLCVHVGIVIKADGRLWVLETDAGTGPTLTKLNAFEARYTRVIYYDGVAS